MVGRQLRRSEVWPEFEKVRTNSKRMNQAREQRTSAPIDSMASVTLLYYDRLAPHYSERC